MNSILSTIKLMLGIEETFEAFDPIIIVYINSAFSTLYQVGVGPDGAFSIKGREETWDDLMVDTEMLNLVKTFIYLKVRLSFDPPANSFIVNSFDKQLDELTWRINAAKEYQTNASDELPESDTTEDF